MIFILYRSVSWGRTSILRRQTNTDTGGRQEQTKFKHGESFSTNQALSLSWHSSKENSWCVGKKFQFLGGGLDLQDGAFSRCKIFLEHKVCIFWSLDWRVALCPISSNSLCMLILWLYIPRCVYWELFHACNQDSRMISCGASTLFWSLWCSRHTSPPPPARPPWITIYIHRHIASIFYNHHLYLLSITQHCC